MRISNITTCLLVAMMASMVAANAFVPASAFQHRCDSTVVGKPPTSYRQIPSSLRSGQDAEKKAQEIPRGGGVNVYDNKVPALPTLTDFRKFAIPCLGLWVAQPLLSLVDTAFVGLSTKVPSQSAAQLAALGPATTFFDGATYLFAFLNVATTNLYSTARAQKGGESDEAEAVICTASRVAFRCGIGIMAFLLAFARPLLALYIGMYTIIYSLCIDFCRVFFVHAINNVV